MPLFGSIIFQQLYNIADSLVAGKFAGENALAAAGASGLRAMNVRRFPAAEEKGLSAAGTANGFHVR